VYVLACGCVLYAAYHIIRIYCCLPCTLSRCSSPCAPGLGQYHIFRDGGTFRCMGKGLWCVLLFDVCLVVVYYNIIIHRDDDDRWHAKSVSHRSSHFIIIIMCTIYIVHPLADYVHDYYTIAAVEPMRSMYNIYLQNSIYLHNVVYRCTIVVLLCYRRIVVFMYYCCRRRDKYK